MHFIPSTDALEFSLVCSTVAYAGMTHTLCAEVGFELSYLAVSEMGLEPLTGTGLLAVGDDEDEDNVTTAGPCELESNLSTRRPVMLEPNK